MARVTVCGEFDDLRLKDFRFLDEASQLGDSLHVLLWSDETIQSLTGKPPKFPYNERSYFLGATRYVREVVPVNGRISPDALPAGDAAGMGIWAVGEAHDSAEKRAWCNRNRVEYRVISDKTLSGLPPAPPVPDNPESARKKVVVTGCYDWFHTGHVRFFEEVSEFGELYVIVGNDENLRLLKGEGHPQFPAVERRYIAGSIRHVTLALIASGMGWLDAEPEILRIKPDVYAVNEDGDKPEKRQFCESRGIEYKVLKRLPKEGLMRRSSTNLRGF